MLGQEIFNRRSPEGRPAVPQHTSVETILNMTPENKEHFQSEKEAIFLLLTVSSRVNDIRAERIAKSANPLALIAALCKGMQGSQAGLKDYGITRKDVMCKQAEQGVPLH
ncbi:hypothetical protein Tco_0080627 [Tanacetum coccineum]